MAWFNYDFDVEDLVHDIDAGEILSSDELEYFCFSDACGTEVYREKGENRRWSRTVFIVKQIGDRYFGLAYDEGLTEYQENEFYEQPYEVEKKEYEKVVTVTEWVEKFKEN